MEANLASGGNDNKVCIWDLRGSRRAAASRNPTNADDSMAGDAPLWKFHEHTAAVKALAWDPHIPGVLATGGGTQDKHIRFWNTINGTMLNELDTGSQVTSFSCSCIRYSKPIRSVSGLQPHMVFDLARTRVNPRLFIDYRPEPDLHMEISSPQYGCIVDGAYQSCLVPGHESGR